MKHAGPRYKDFPSLKKRGLRIPVRQVAVIQTWRTAYGPKGEETPLLTIELHGAARVMVGRVVEAWCGVLCKGYTLTWEPIATRLNGRCSSSLVLTIDRPDLHILGACEWAPLLKDRMERLFHCRVTVFTDYNRWLNA